MEEERRGREGWWRRGRWWRGRKREPGRLLRLGTRGPDGGAGERTFMYSIAVSRAAFLRSASILVEGAVPSAFTASRKVASFANAKLVCEQAGVAESGVIR